MACSNSLTILHSSITQCITTFIVYVTACDLNKSFIFDMAITIMSYVHFPIRVGAIFPTHEIQVIHIGTIRDFLLVFNYNCVYFRKLKRVT